MLLLLRLAQRPMCPCAHHISPRPVLTEEEVLPCHRKISGRQEKGSEADPSGP